MFLKKFIGIIMEGVLEEKKINTEVHCYLIRELNDKLHSHLLQTFNK